MRSQFQKELEEWKTAGSAAVTKLAELRVASGDSWDAIKIEMEKVWHSIEDALDQAESKRRAHEDNAKMTAPAPMAPPARAEAKLA